MTGGYTDLTLVDVDILRETQLLEVHMFCIVLYGQHLVDYTDWEILDPDERRIANRF